MVITNIYSCEEKDDALRKIIDEIQTKCKFRYGYRRIQIVLNKKYALTINHKKELRIMNNIIYLLKYVENTFILNPEMLCIKHENLLEQNFKATGKLQVDYGYFLHNHAGR